MADSLPLDLRSAFPRHLTADVEAVLSRFPFVVQLVGEYVLEIHEDINANLQRIDIENMACFVRENRPFLELTRQRVASCWDCYFRGVSLKLRDHVAHRVLAWMEATAEVDE